MRRRRAAKRELIPDVKYNSELVARLINTIMTRGKKSTAQGIVYGAFDLIKNGWNLGTFLGENNISKGDGPIMHASSKVDRVALFERVDIGDLAESLIDEVDFLDSDNRD